MDTGNPYQSPAVPAELLEPEWPTSGVYRDGHYLVLHHTSRLPPICLKTNLPAVTEIPANLVGGLPNDGSIPATRRKWYGDKVYVVQVPLSAQALRRAAWIRGIAYFIASITFLCLVLTTLFFTKLGQLGWAEAVPVYLLVGLIVSVALLSESRHHLRLECIARGYFWLANAPWRYLQELPAWPVPRPSWWRRAFFGPAGVSSTHWEPKNPAAPESSRNRPE